MMDHNTTKKPMKAKLIKKDDNYFLEVDYWYPKFIRPSLIANTFEKPDGDIYNLSKQNCDEIFGVVDVEKLAEKEVFQEYYDWGGGVFSEDYLMSKRLHFIEGFNKAIELNKDKQFTLEDIEKAIEYGIQSVLQAVPGVTSIQSILDKFIQHPTTIEVEIEMKKVVVETKVVGAVKGVKGSGDKITTYKSVPKLDEKGCLILKKIE